MNDEEKEIVNFWKDKKDIDLGLIMKLIDDLPTFISIIDKLQKENEELHEEINWRVALKVENERYVDKEMINKQVIRDKIKEWDKSIKWNNSDDYYYAIKILKELLGESEDK